MTERIMKALFGLNRAEQLITLVPGLLLAVAVMVVAMPLSELVGRWLLQWQGLDPRHWSSPISAVSMAILLGLFVRNTLHPSDRFKPGINFSVAKLLRFGIILVGIKLSVMDIVKLGAWGIPVVMTAIATGLICVSWINRRMKLPDRLGTLMAAGTSICGVTAIVSTAPAIQADEREVAYAVANVTLFGLLAMLTYPYVAPLLLHSSEQVGLFLGTAVHDTSQVVGAALTYKQLHHDDVAFRAATVTKLTRNLFLAVVVPLLAFYHLRRSEHAVPAADGRIRISGLLPVFVLGFIGMALLRSVGDATLPSGRALGLFDAAAWKALTTHLGETWGSRYVLGTALAAVGLGTSLSVFRGIGWKPFAVGLAGALAVGLSGLLLALLLGPMVKL